MSILSRQVSAVSQELQEMTSLLKPLFFHNTSMLMIPSAVTLPTSISSHSCSPAPSFLIQRTPEDSSDNQNPTSVSGPEASSPPLSMATVLQEPFDPLQCSPLRTIISQNPPQVSHWSAPPSLNSSPHECTIVPPPLSSSFIPCLSSSSHPSSITPLSVDLSGPDVEPQTQACSCLPNTSQSATQPQSQGMFFSYPHSLSQPLLQPSSMASHPQETLLDLEEVEWGNHTAQLSLKEEQPSVWRVKRKTDRQKQPACHKTYCMKNIWPDVYTLILHGFWLWSWAPFFFFTLILVCLTGNIKSKGNQALICHFTLEWGRGLEGQTSLKSKSWRGHKGTTKRTVKQEQHSKLKNVYWVCWWLLLKQVK